jgi:NAD(P)-dependent dehydrogenase (short-subunit alcohol dehydrogenase family)
MGTDRTVLVTGANSGLGLATVLEVARRGYRAVGSVRSESKADQVRAAASERGVAVDTVLLDVTDADRCAQVVDELAPYGIVNNAGFSQTGAIEDVDDAEVRAVLETMVVAPMRLARLALPGMRERSGGCIVNISSIYGRTSTPFTGWYQAAKHALEGATDALRMEVAGFGVKVVLIEPGGFRTAIFDEVAADVARRGESAYRAGYERILRTLRLASPFMGDPATVARVVGRVLGAPSPRARYLVGADAQVLALAERLTPTFVADVVTRRTLGL